ncbi:MAG: MAPEG family protein [Pseudomonadota bacterium]
MLTVAPIYIGLLSLLFLGLSIRVIRARRAEKVSIGTGGNKIVERAMRVQANCMEYSLFFIALLMTAELQGTPGWLLHLLGLGFLAARLAHAYGLSTEAAPSSARIGGMAVSLLLLLLLALGVIAHAIF